MIHNFKKHIAIIFILVFFYPTIYQANHILHFPHQHTHEHHDSHSGIASYKKYCSEEDCPVCDFHYAILYIDENNPDKFSFEYYPLTNTKLSDNPFITYSGNIKLLRAPPVFGSNIS